MSERHNHHHNHHHHHHNTANSEAPQCKCLQTATAVQGLDELEFERGIWSAALYNDVDRLRERIARGETNQRDNFGYTALHYAARQKHADACKLLLAAGASVDARTTAGGVTALHRAASMGCDRIVQLLLAHGANINIADDDGNTALHRATAAAHPATCALLCAHQTGGEALALATNKRSQRAADLVPADRRAQFEGVFTAVSNN